MKVYDNNMVTEMLIDTGAEMFAISQNFVNKCERYFKNAPTIPSDPLAIQMVTNGKERVKQQKC